MKLVLLALCLIGGLLILALIALYNRLAVRRNQIENAISATDALFIKRSDLIPNLITTAKQYMQFEAETLERITAMREVRSRSTPEQQQEADATIRGLKVQMEAYPELKASQQFRDLMYSMNEVEEQISAGRRYISASITAYNDALTTFPGNVVAGMFNFRHYTWQYATDQQRTAVDAAHLFNK